MERTADVPLVEGDGMPISSSLNGLDGVLVPLQTPSRSDSFPDAGPSAIALDRLETESRPSAPTEIGDAHRRLAASVVETGGTTRHASEAVSVRVKFRPALAAVPNAMHAFIQIDRADGSRQILAAYPVGGTSQTHEGGQLTYATGLESRADQHASDHAYALHAPAGTSLTAYADSLVAGAKAYNEHAARYDGLGENPDRYNSNSFVSSLVIAKGGAAGLTDVRRIARNFDAGDVRTDGKPPTTDGEMAEHVRIDSDRARLTMTGWGHIQPAWHYDAHAPRDAATPPPRAEMGDISGTIAPILKETTRTIQNGFKHTLHGWLHRSVREH